jgi:hypothetical protein
VVQINEAQADHPMLNAEDEEESKDQIDTT